MYNSIASQPNPHLEPDWYIGRHVLLAVRSLTQMCWSVRGHHGSTWFLVPDSCPGTRVIFCGVCVCVCDTQSGWMMNGAAPLQCTRDQRKNLNKLVNQLSGLDYIFIYHLHVWTKHSWQFAEIWISVRLKHGCVMQFAVNNPLNLAQRFMNFRQQFSFLGGSKRTPNQLWSRDAS